MIQTTIPENTTFSLSLLLAFLLLFGCAPSGKPGDDQAEEQENEQEEEQTNDDANEHQDKNDRENDGEKPEEHPPYREISIPDQEHGYQNFGSTVLDSEKELKNFLDTQAAEETRGWNKLPAFKNALENAEIDFDREALVLVRQDASQGNIQVAFKPDVKNDDQLVVRITKKGEGGIGSSVMQYYCFGLAVNRETISEVQIKPEDGETETLQVE